MFVFNGKLAHAKAPNLAARSSSILVGAGRYFRAWAAGATDAAGPPPKRVAGLGRAAEAGCCLYLVPQGAKATKVNGRSDGTPPRVKVRMVIKPVPPVKVATPGSVAP